MSSDFQRRKVVGVFAAMDVDGDGFLTEQDFRALTDRWTGIRSWASGTAGHEQLSAVMMGWWQTLWVEFWAGDNPDAPGSLVFGRV